MYNVLKKHRRRLMAFFGVILMVAFLIPTVAKNPQPGDVVMGTVHGKKIMYGEKIRADRDWHLIRSINIPSGRGMYGTIPLAAAFGPSPTGVAMNEIERHQDLFMLLLLDAKSQGIHVTDDRVEQLYEFAKYGIPGFDPADTNQVEGAWHALRSYLMVRDAFDRAIAAVRVSAPVREYEIATRVQALKVGAVAFSSDEYLAKVPAAGKEQLEAFFSKYRDVDPSAVELMSTANPFGFGYRFPDRAALQYILVSTDEVRNAVKQSKPEADWRREAAKFYWQHQERFQAPSTQPGIDTTGLSVPTTTTRPYTDPQVSKEAMEIVISEQARKLQGQIVSRINSTLVNDYNTFRQAKPGEKVTSSLGVAYDSYEYMQALAQSIQKTFKVLPTVEQVGDLTSAGDLANKPRIGMARTPTGLSFGQYAAMTEESRRAMLRVLPGAPALLLPWQPSQLVRNMVDDTGIFRVIRVDPAHAPKTMDEVAQKVAQDYQKEQAFELAKKAAAEFAQAAKAQGFATTTQAQGKTLSETGFFSRGLTDPINLKLDDKGDTVFATVAMKELLQGKSNGENRPIALVPIARGGKVFVTQLEQVRQSATAEQLADVAMQVDRAVVGTFATRLEQDWFSYKNVIARTAFTPVEGQKRENDSAPEAPEPPAAPFDL